MHGNPDATVSCRLRLPRSHYAARNRQRPLTEPSATRVWRRRIILPNLCNNLHQIVQTADHVVIHSEMVHDARFIRIGGRHRPSTTRTWLGDLVGRWEGDALVVDTINFRPKNGFLDPGESLHVVERFSRMDDSTLRYQFTVSDPHMWSQSWTARVRVAVRRASHPRVRLSREQLRACRHSARRTVRRARTAIGRSVFGPHPSFHGCRLDTWSASSDSRVQSRC